MAQSEAAAEEKAERKPEKPAHRFYVVNMVRRQATRALRRKPLGGKSHRFNLRICGGKVMLRRGKALPMPEEYLEAHSDELKQLMLEGKIDIREGGPHGPSIGMPDAPRPAPKKKPEPEVEAEAEEAPAEEELEAEPEEAEEEEVVAEEIPEPDKPLDKMNKAELIEYCVLVTGMDHDELEGMVKREILEAIQGVLES